FADEHGLDGETLVVGLNTGAGGRWTSKGLPVERVAAFAGGLAAAVAAAEEERSAGPGVAFVVLGGPAERERNAEILAGIEGLGLRAVDGGTDNSLTEFAAIVGRCGLLLTSDSLALHLGVATETPIVAFFAPTSAAEIELYGLGEKVVSTSPDYCSYARDADRSTLTVERLVAASLRVLARSR
ncbi:MAG: glycosyltransferase family 9 protein, partial [Planctomycetota bacterium]